MGWRGRTSGGLGNHPLISTADAVAAVLQHAPSTVFVLDERAELVWANPAGHAELERARTTVGQAEYDRGMAEFKAWLRGTTSFPARKVFTRGAGAAIHSIRSTADRVPGGYVTSWEDVSDFTRVTEGARAATGRIAEYGASLAALGDELAGSAGAAASQADALLQGAGELTGSIREISTGASAAASSTGTAVASAQHASDSVAKLAASSEEIGSISRLITAIAEQTNLLALNATIEAARAGEAGRGFNVVATEVKELARRTAEATDQISAMIATIQADSASAGDAIGRIVALIGEIEAQQTTIAGAVDEQSATAGEISGRVDNIARSTNDAAAVAGRVREVAEQLADGAGELQSAMGY
ncbi:methyl-accepting chemotaxis protein [Kineococcus glutinatus]|uniref:Methyl-accepting transducer domain-containing protein n=1 Tax=Kineococcus glutinatus TaxID=1070872 RepID=A0ABP9HBU0_9ACTN